MSTLDEDATRATYDTMAPRWAGSYEQQKSFWGMELRKFQSLLPSGHILEIGAGGGRDAEALVKAGYTYTGIDNSEGMVTHARKAHPDLTFSVQDVCNLSFPDGTQFDGFWAAAVLLHLPKSKINSALEQIRQVMRPGAIGVITLREGKGEGLRKTIKHGLPDERYFAHYTKTEFNETLHRNGFSLLEADSWTEGNEYTWLSFFVKTV